MYFFQNFTKIIMDQSDATKFPSPCTFFWLLSYTWQDIYKLCILTYKYPKPVFPIKFSIRQKVDIIASKYQSKKPSISCFPFRSTFFAPDVDPLKTVVFAVRIHCYQTILRVSIHEETMPFSDVLVIFQYIKPCSMCITKTVIRTG